MTHPTRDQTAAGEEMIGAPRPPRSALSNRAAARGIRTLQLLVSHPTSAPGLATAIDESVEGAATDV